MQYGKAGGFLQGHDKFGGRRAVDTIERARSQKAYPA